MNQSFVTCVQFFVLFIFFVHKAQMYSLRCNACLQHMMGI